MTDSNYYRLTITTTTVHRSEMQMLFEEMTQHIQQQSDSHKYLEKLRIENERTALQEKDRKVL